MVLERGTNDPSDHHGIPGRSLGNESSLPTLRKGFGCSSQSSVLPPGPLPLHYPLLYFMCQSPNIGIYVINHALILLCTVMLHRPSTEHSIFNYFGEEILLARSVLCPSCKIGFHQKALLSQTTCF